MFMDLMNRVFKRYLNAFVVVFIDDILIYFPSKEEHISHLRVMLQTLRDKWLFTRFTKCELLLKDVAFLGHVASDDSIKVDQKKTEAVKN